MIHALQLFRNVGQFDTAAAADLGLARSTLVYAENGRGKTTLAAVLRSLATGDPLLVSERRRLSSVNPPHIVIDCAGGPPPAVFQNNAWNRTLPNMVVFDDTFVDENVCSGLVVEADHRQHLHEWILGAQGVTLNRVLQEAVARIERHNRDLRAKGDAIPANVRGPFGVDEFCALAARADVDATIQDAERNLAAAREHDVIRRTPPFDPITLPEIDVAGLVRLLALEFDGLDSDATTQVQRHIDAMGRNSEPWVASGMQWVSDKPGQSCPFCSQNLDRSLIITHYRAYFGAAYRDLKQRIATAINEFVRTHGDEAPVGFERAIRVVGERRQFWSRFSDLPEVALDTAVIVQTWADARKAILSSLHAKESAPLERVEFPRPTIDLIRSYEQHRREVSALSDSLRRVNDTLALVKEQAAAGNIAALTADVARLKAVKVRHTPEIARLCADYLDEKIAKAASERQRDQARASLDRHRLAIFPAYETAINLYLQRFSAGFRLGQVTSVNTRAGSSCTYNVLINHQAVAVGGADPPPGAPSFRTALSAGDRNTLALAFFFASLDHDPALANKIVVIDDPITSLDEHRSLTTVQEVRRLGDRVTQLIVLSHDRSFLCNIWQGLDTDTRTALEVTRDGEGSAIRAWDINRDSITEHDRRHALLRDYLAAATPNNREVAESLRPVLESFLRVAYPEHFPPGCLLGPFRNVCTQRVGTAQEILGQPDITELRDLTEYANRFHHDTNPAWQAAHINDGELLNFVRRTLAFVKR